MITLYTYWRSSAAYRARIGLNLKGIEYESRFVHLLRDGGEQHSAEYRRVNPESRVPTLVHDGITITQSLAILEYLEERFPEPPLLPSDPTARARVRSLAQLVASDMQPLQNTSVTRYLRTKLGASDEQVAGWVQDWIHRGLTVLEQRLAHDRETGEFCHGAQPTLADCCLVPQCYSARRFGVDPAQHPTIRRIEQSCESVPAFARAAPERQPDAE